MCVLYSQKRISNILVAVTIIHMRLRRGSRLTSCWRCGSLLFPFLPNISWLPTRVLADQLVQNEIRLSSTRLIAGNISAKASWANNDEARLSPPRAFTNCSTVKGFANTMTLGVYGKKQPPLLRPIFLTNYCNHHTQRRAKEEVVKAQRRGIPIRELSGSTPPGSQQSSLFERTRPKPTTSRGTTFDPPQGHVDCYEEEEEDGVPLPSRIISKSWQDLHAETRDRSRSAWLYFPHIELVVLFFAFDGAVAAELAAVRENGCSWVVFTACTALAQVI